MKNFIIFFSLLLITQTAFATIWITISDPQGNKIGAVGASSGLIGNSRTLVAVDNVGIAAIGSWYLDGSQKHVKALMRNQALTAHEVVKEFSRMINQDSYKRRVSFVNARFENASEPGRGCHSHNYYCGKYEDPLFTITGGGLVSPDVITSAKNTLQDQMIEAMPIQCRMYHGIRAIFLSGGEFKRIERLAYIVDDLSVKDDNGITLFHRKGHENSLLEQFAKKLKSRGFNCGF